MAWSSPVAIVGVALAAAIPPSAPVRAQANSDLSGRWTINRDISQLPRDIGFGADWVSAVGGQDSTASGGRGRRGSGGGGTSAFSLPPESEDDARRVQQLTDEVRDPSSHLTIVDTPTAVTITDDRGHSRTFHPDGKEAILQLDGVPVGVTTKREAGRLVVLYSVEKARQLRYTYSRTASPPQLVVDVQFIERGGGGRVRRVYEPASETETSATATAAASSATTKPGAGLPAVSAPDSGKGRVSESADRPPTQLQAFNQQPGAELKGLSKLGVVVEDLSPQAATCGLSQGALETAVSQHLTDAGFTVRRNSDEDTYVYVNVMTTSLSTGFCVSRYDVFLYTHTTATLSYQKTPVLVQVSLLHKGGIAGGAPAAHADGVLRGVQDYVDQFATRIRDSNK